MKAASVVKAASAVKAASEVTSDEADARMVDRCARSSARNDGVRLRLSAAARMAAERMAAEGNTALAWPVRQRRTLVGCSGRHGRSTLKRTKSCGFESSTREHNADRPWRRWTASSAVGRSRAALIEMPWRLRNCRFRHSLSLRIRQQTDHALLTATQTSNIIAPLGLFCVPW